MADWHRALLAGADVLGLAQQRLGRLARESWPHAWIARVETAALAARCAELQRGTKGLRADEVLARWPLYGVPFAVKDNIDAAGFATTAACPAWSHWPESSASVVQKLLDAGALLFGKTNLDQFATGLVGTRSPYGAPAGVFAADRISGGSSSGSAVAVAAGEVAFSLGTDTAGSGRVPAAFNGLVGVKPTPGRVSTTGVLPACRSLDCVSIFAHDVADAAAVLAVIEGPDEQDAYSHFAPGAAALPVRARLGIPKAAALDDTIGYDSAWQRACAQARSLGAELVEIDFGPLHDVAALLYDGPWVAERYAVVRDLLDRDPTAFDPTVAAVIARARQHDAVAAFEGQYALQRGRQRAQALWRQLDALLVPSVPTHPRFEQVAADPIGVNSRLGAYTNFVNLLGWCALALPAGHAAQGLPFGVTVIGPGGADAALLAWGRRWQARATDARAPTHDTQDTRGTSPPLPQPATETTLPIAVVGAHLSGLPLNSQLTERGATLDRATRTAAHYRLYALPGTQPPKPGLVRVAGDDPGGTSVALEVWRMPIAAVGSFLALIPAPLSLGSIELEDGSRVHGFLCEAVAVQGAREVSRFGGWRAYLAAGASD